MRSALLGVLAIAGCNQLFDVQSTELLPDADLRPDRDHDGLADLDDPCIAPQADLDDDLDEDGVANATDNCSISNRMTDSDGDGVGDDCDLFGTLAGDRRRCTMRFFDVETNAALWKPRDGEEEFALSSGYLVGFEQAPPVIASIVAQDRITATTGTTLMLISVGGLLGGAFSFRVWVSAGSSPSASDVACDVHGDDTSYFSRIVIGSDIVTSAPQPSFGGGGLVIVIFQPGKAGANVACMAALGPETAIARGHFDGELQQQGFAVLEGAVAMTVVAIFERDDHPEL